MERENQPRRWRVKLKQIPGAHPARPDSVRPYLYGCYFPVTDLNVSEMGHRGTGEPRDVDWIDEEEGR